MQNLRDDDFIEIELDRQELTYQDLLRVSCCELGINPQHVERIRKLPNTVLRKVGGGVGDDLTECFAGTSKDISVSHQQSVTC